ncbi:MAG: recombinase A, partial [Mycoplasmataceae bacterium CE_OT135]
MLKKKSSEESSEISTQQEIKEIIENIKKEFGEDSVTLLGEDKNKDWEVVPTGSYLLDQAIGTGGYVCGKI